MHRMSHQRVSLRFKYSSTVHVSIAFHPSSPQQLPTSRNHCVTHAKENRVHSVAARRCRRIARRVGKTPIWSLFVEKSTGFVGSIESWLGWVELPLLMRVLLIMNRKMNFKTFISTDTQSLKERARQILSRQLQYLSQCLLGKRQVRSITTLFPHMLRNGWCICFQEHPRKARRGDGACSDTYPWSIVSSSVSATMSKLSKISFLSSWDLKRESGEWWCRAQADFKTIPSASQNVLKIPARSNSFSSKVPATNTVISALDLKQTMCRSTTIISTK